jgi:photosystem II stability/assembly factor-like uncharacterized protein
MKRYSSMRHIHRKFPLNLIMAWLFLTVSGSLTAQQQQHDMNTAPLEKPAARKLWNHDRVTFPGGSIPVGARVRAWSEAQDRMQLFAPTGKGQSFQSYEWSSVGPFNVGGRIVTLAVNPKNPHTIFIGAAGGGIWRTHDEGRSWHCVSDELPTQAMGAIVIDPVDTNIVYAGTGEASYALNTFDGGGMFKSTDGGSTWFEIGAGTLPPYGRASFMVINPMNTSIVYAAIPDGFRDPQDFGIWRSTDAGDTWSHILDGRMNDIVINVQNPDILYTVSSAVSQQRTAARYGVFKTTDGGDTWSKLELPGINDTLMGRTSVGICDAAPDVVYLGVSALSGSDRTPLLGVYKTEDGGENWRKLTVPFDYMISQGWFDNVMGVHPENPDIVYAGGVKLIYSTDGGESWTRVPDQGYGGIVHVDQHAIGFNRDNPSTVYLGNDGGFYVGMNDGKDWEKRDYGMAITQFIGGAMHPSTNAVLFGGTQDNGTLLSRSGPDFDLVLYGDGGNGAIDPRRPHVMYTTRETLKFYRSDDFGATWTRSQNGLGMDRSLFYIDYAMDPSNPDVLYLGTSNMYKSTNGATTWSRVATCLLGSGNVCYFISSVFVAPYDGNIVMAGSNAGGITISTDAGVNWNRVPDGILPFGYCSSVRSFEADVFYATYSRYGVPKVWRSTDGGVSWEDINGNLPDVPVNDIIVLDGKLIIGSEVGAFISDDDGLTWQRFGSGMPSVAVFKLRYNERTGTLRAITHGRGLFDLQWRQPDAAAPFFVSLPDTVAVERGLLFVYAPVTDAWPPASFRLLEGPAEAFIDEELGIIRWAADGEARFTLEAHNEHGVARQVFTIAVRPWSGVDWEIVQPHPVQTPVNTLVLAADGSLWMGRDSAIVMRSIDEGRNWSEYYLPGGKGNVVCMHAFDAERALAGTRDGRILRTTDGGVTWSVQVEEINAFFRNLSFADEAYGLAIADHPDRKDYGVVFASSDGGVTWNNIAQAPARLVLDNTLVMHDADSAWFASSNYSRPSPGGPDILRTTDGGHSWAAAGVSAQHISAMAFVDALAGFCVDDMSGVIRRTTDGGNGWRAAFYPMSGERNAVVAATREPSAVWIVNDTHAWVSTSRGQSWTSTALVPSGPVQAAVFADSARAWVVTKAGIVQRLRKSPLLEMQTLHTPSSVRLYPPWPNPLTDGSTESMLRFGLDTPMHVQLDVFNSAGVRVASLVDARLAAGEHQAVFSAEGLPAGTYFAQLRATTFSQTVRILLLR